MWFMLSFSLCFRFTVCQHFCYVKIMNCMLLLLLFSLGLLVYIASYIGPHNIVLDIYRQKKLAK